MRKGVSSRSASPSTRKGMKRFVKPFLDRLPYIRKLRAQVEKQGTFPAGHFYSPIPDKGEVRAYVESRTVPPHDLPGIQLNRERQFRILTEYAHFYKDLPFPEQQRPDCRYYYDNEFYSYADAIFLYS